MIGFAVTVLVVAIAAGVVIRVTARLESRIDPMVTEVLGPVRVVVLVHPADVNLADAKAMAAQYDATIIGNPYCPRGQAFLINPAALGMTGGVP